MGNAFFQIQEKFRLAGTQTQCRLPVEDEIARPEMSKPLSQELQKWFSSYYSTEILLSTEEIAALMLLS